MPKNLSVRLTASADDYVSTVELAADRTDALGDQANQASERVERLGDKATTTGGSLSTLATSGAGASASISTVGATAATAAVGVGALSSALLPLVGTLGAVATAASGLVAGFGAVMGSGFYAYQQKLKEQGSSLSEELKAARKQLHKTAMRLGTEFVPMVSSAVESLPAFIRKIEAAVGDLTPFANALRDAGQAAFDVVPKMVSEIMDLGRDALPAVRKLGGFFMDTWKPALDTAVDATSKLITPAKNLLSAIVDLIPPAYEFGTTVLKTAIPAVTAFVEAMTSAFKIGNDLVEQFKGPLTSAVDTASGAIDSGLSAFRDLKAETQAAIGGLSGVTGAAVAFPGAFSTAGGALSSFATTLLTLSNPLTATAAGVAGIGAAVGTLAATTKSEGETISSTLSGWVSSFDSALDSIKTTLVGGSGDGGLTDVVDNAVTNAQQWLQTEGPTIIKEGIGAVVDAAVDSASTLQDILVGPDGKSGILTEMIDQADTFLSETAPELIGAAAEAVGEAIRDGLIDFTNPLRGKKSKIWSMLDDSVTWLVDNIPQLLGAVGEAIVDAIISGVTGLYEGLVGNSVIKEDIEEAAEEAIKKMGTWMAGVGNAIKNVILNGLSGLAGALASKINNAAETAADNVGNDGIGDERPAGGCPTGSTWDPEEQRCVSQYEDTYEDDEYDGPTGDGRGRPPTDTGPDNGGEDDLTPREKRLKDKIADGISLTPREQRQRDLITGAATGGHIAEAGLLNVHEGEQVVPASQVSDRGEVTVDMDAVVDELRAVRRTMEREFDVSVEIRDTDRYQTVRR